MEDRAPETASNEEAQRDECLRRYASRAFDDVDALDGGVHLSNCIIMTALLRVDRNLADDVDLDSLLRGAAVQTTLARAIEKFSRFVARHEEYEQALLRRQARK